MEGHNIKGFRSLVRLAVKAYLAAKRFRLRREDESLDVAEPPPEYAKPSPKPVNPQKPVQIIEVRFPKVELPKIRIPYLRDVKRYMAGVLFLVNVVLALSTFMVPQSQILIVFFLANAFILLDYLWKTRRGGGD